MQALSLQLPSSPHKRVVSFAPEVDAKAEERAIRDDKKKVNRLLLQSDVAFVVDISFSLKLLEQAKAIIDQRFSKDDELIAKYTPRINILRRELQLCTK